MTRHYFHSVQLKFQCQIIFHFLAEFIALLPISPHYTADAAIFFIVYVRLPYCSSCRSCCLAIKFLFPLLVFLFFFGITDCNIILKLTLLGIQSLSKHFRLIDSIVFQSFRNFIQVWAKSELNWEWEKR